MPEAVTLEFWGVFDEEEYFDDIITTFQTQLPYVTIEYKKFRADEYEAALFDAWAKNEGPDIFAIPNYHMGKYKDYIIPLPKSLTVTTATIEKSLGKEETVINEEIIKSVLPNQMGTYFPDVVYSDVVISHIAEDEKDPTDKVFGMPLSIDTLALYYNKDLLNQAQIALPPNNWVDFLENVNNISTVDKNGNLLSSGAALGTTENIPRIFDIISILMMQNGATMTDGDRVVFDQAAEDQDDYFPGQAAVGFYTSFASPDKESYSWNANMPDAIDYFAAGNLAFLFGYHYHLDQVKELAPNLNFDIATLPQVNPENQTNYANYWNYSVSINSGNPNEAWYFIQNMTTNEELAKSYLDLTERPAALKSLITGQEEVYELIPFNAQTLTSKSWYHGLEPAAAEDIFAEMITNVNNNIETIEKAVQNTAKKIELTLEPQ